MKMIKLTELFNTDINSVREMFYMEAVRYYFSYNVIEAQKLMNLPKQ